MANLSNNTAPLQPSLEQLARRGNLLGAGLAYASLALALVLVCVLGAWGGYRDYTQVRQTFMQAEMGRFVSHALRTVSNIEHDLDTGAADNLEDVAQLEWVRRHWRNIGSQMPARTCSAISDINGRIISHSNHKYDGVMLHEDPRANPAYDVSPDVYYTHDPMFTYDGPVYMIVLPIDKNGTQIGTYLANVRRNWFENRLMVLQQRVIRRWLMIIGGILLVVTCACASLFFLARQSARLYARLKLADARRWAELSQIIIGLAHEIRNPLNAVRLNLHALERVYRDEAWIPADEIRTLLGDSCQEVDRVELLMREMLGYTRPESMREETINLATEMESAARFLRSSLDASETKLILRLPPAPIYMRMDRQRLRQVLLNLLSNARDAVGRGGVIELELSQLRSAFQLTCSDNGPGIPDGQRERIFEPFYSTKTDGVGLGLALVRKFVEESGGVIVCEPRAAGGTVFRIEWPSYVPPLIQEPVHER